MKSILHVYDQAGISCILAKWQRKLGHKVTVIKTRRDDELGFLEYYNETLSDLSPIEFDDYCITLSKDYDIIHCHSVSEVAYLIKCTYPEKKVFIHYHGSDLRTNPINHECNGIVNGIFYATPDLEEYLPAIANYIPTTIDTDMFYKKSKGGSGTIFKRDDIKCKYRYTPHFYRSFDTFLDEKYVLGKLIHGVSKTAYECMALGLQVIDWNGNVYNKLPEEHNPNNVVQLIESYYVQ